MQLTAGLLLAQKKVIAAVSATCLVLFAGSSSAIVVSHVNPAYPIGSNVNAANFRCADNTVPCRLFGVGTVLVQKDDGLFYSCSATPIGPRTVLSAAHCFDGKDAGGNVDTNALASTTFRIPGVLGSIRGTPVNYPGYSGAVVDNRDIALVILDFPLPSWVPIFKLTSFQKVPLGAVVTHVGYGRTGTGLTGPVGTTLVGTVNIMLNTIDAVRDDGKIFIQDFDGGGYNRFGGGPLQQWGGKPGYNIYFEGATAKGDSGGPVLYNTKEDYLFRPLPVTPKLLPDQYEIVGVASYGTDINRNAIFSDYGDTSGFVFVGPYVPWIKSVSPDVAAADSVLNHDLTPNPVVPSGVDSNEQPTDADIQMPDMDADLVHDDVDNCIDIPNYEQEDADENGRGDACELVDLIGFTLKKSLVAGCKSVSGTVTLSAPAPAGGVTVNIVDTLAAANSPATVKVPEGVASKSFSVKSSPVESSESGTVSVSLGRTTLSQPLTLRPMGMSSLALAPNPVVGGSAVSGTAKLECKAGPGPITVSLASTNATVALPSTASVVVPTGSQTVSFMVITTPVAVTTRPKISASAGGISRSRTLTVAPAN